MLITITELLEFSVLFEFWLKAGFHKCDLFSIDKRGVKGDRFNIDSKILYLLTLLFLLLLSLFHLVDIFLHWIDHERIVLVSECLFITLFFTLRSLEKVEFHINYLGLLQGVIGFNRPVCIFFQIEPQLLIQIVLLLVKTSASYLLLDFCLVIIGNILHILESFDRASLLRSIRLYFTVGQNIMY